MIRHNTSGMLALAVLLIASVVASGSSVLAASSFSEGRNVEHRYELPLRTLPPGEYLLRFVAEAAGRRATREVRFSIR